MIWTRGRVHFLTLRFKQKIESQGNFNFEGSPVGTAEACLSFPFQHDCIILSKSSFLFLWDCEELVIWYHPNSNVPAVLPKVHRNKWKLHVWVWFYGKNSVLESLPPLFVLRLKENITSLCPHSHRWWNTKVVHHILILTHPRLRCS